VTLMLSYPVVVTVVLATLVAATTDVLRFKVHNFLTYPLLLAGIVYHSTTEGQVGLMGSLLGAALGFGFLFLFFLLGGMGAGDVKLLAGIGAWLGVEVTFYVLIASSLAAGVYALGLVALNRRHAEIWIRLQVVWHRTLATFRTLGAEERVEAEVRRADRRSRVIPFAAMVAVGVIATMFWLGRRGTP
jgi:prepilin peptidase CpaA